MNKKQLYESIMMSVAKEVKKALNEQIDIPNHEEIIDIIKKADWNGAIEEGWCDHNIGIHGGNIYTYIPGTSYILDFDVTFKWKYINYIPATRYQPDEGGYNELKNYTIDKVTLYSDDNKVLMDLSELKDYIHEKFEDLIIQLAEDAMYNSNENNYNIETKDFED